MRSDVTCPESRFLSDVENHTINIIKDDGVYRHISISNNGSSVYRYDLITWSGHLCIAGYIGRRAGKSRLIKELARLLKEHPSMNTDPKVDPFADPPRYITIDECLEMPMEMLDQVKANKPYFRMNERY